MTKAEFVAMLTEEGLTIKEAEFIWDGRPSDDLSADDIRFAARKTLPVAKVIRSVMAAHEKVYCRVHGMEPCRCDGRHLTEKGGES